MLRLPTPTRSIKVKLDACGQAGRLLDALQKLMKKARGE
jgi:hypothetical protein